MNLADIYMHMYTCIYALVICTSSGASFFMEGKDGRGTTLLFCCEAEAELELLEQRGWSFPKKALLVEGKECSASSVESEWREFKAQSC